MSQKTWYVIFFNLSEDIKIMKTYELKELLRDTPYDKILSIYVAPQERANSNWTCITDVEEFQKIIFGEEPKEESYEGSERRMYYRYEAHLKVLINHGNSFFTSESINISRGGLKLSHEVPESLNDKYCVIKLALPDHEASKPLVFFGHVKNVAGQARVMFQSEEKSGDSSFVDWIQDQEVPGADAA